MKDELLSKIKKALMIPLEEKYADAEITVHISSARELIMSVGVKEEVAKSDNALVEAIILIYAKTFFGFKTDGSVKELPSSFDMLLRQLALTVKE